MSTDLLAWREALSSGGFPTPSLERWQVLRAGVVNLWEFEAVEYWYANGWAQLMGRNETGKSSLMALTTLIPWLGDTSSDKIDTLGRSGKQFLYYVRPTGDSDRRDADASTYHGWLWVEYGRLRDGRPEFFTTLLHALARMGNSSPRLTWCTSSGSRVRQELLLAEGRSVATPGQLTASGFESYGTAADYKKALASRLLGGTVAQLEAIGKLLKVTRQPKLGAQLNAEFVTSHLRESLPELNRSEVAELANGWDQLDHLRDDLERANQAAEQVARFERDGWRPWARALLRLHADDVATKQTELDAVTRDERAAGEELASGRQAEEDLQSLQTDAEARAATARQQAEALRASAAYRDASARIELADQQERAVATAERSRIAAEQASHDAQLRAADAQAGHQRKVAELEEAEAILERRDDRVRAAARTAGVACAPPLDPDLVEQLCRERQTAVRHVFGLLSEYAHAHQLAENAETIASARQASADESKKRADNAWQDAQTQHDAVAAALRAWAPASASTRVIGWIEALPRTPDQSDAPALRELIRRDFYDPRHADLSGRLQRAEADLQAADAQVHATTSEIAALEQAGITPPSAPTLWQRRDRADASGAPFWQLVNPLPDAPAADLAQVEAALAASGLLDAWASREPGSELDTFVMPAEDAQPGRRLSALLSVADDAGELGELVGRVLDSVTLCAAAEPLPLTGVAVAVDGRWRNSGLAGRAAPKHPQAEWLGSAAREAQRQRRLAELTAQLVTQKTIASELRDAQQQLASELADLDDQFRDAPNDQLLRKALANYAAMAETAETAQQDATRALDRAHQERLAADERQAALRRAAHEHELPTEPTELDRVRAAIVDTDHALQRWRDQSRVRDSALAAEADDRQRAERFDNEADAGRQAAAQAEHALRLAQARLSELRSAIDQADAEILDRLVALKAAGEQAELEAKQAGNELNSVTERRSAAAQKLAAAARRREDASAERGRAQARLRRLLDAGLASGVVTDLPEPHSALVDHVRAQAAEIRRQLTPRGWQDGSSGEGQQANSYRVEQLRLDLDNKARDARGVLEQSGRSIQVVPTEPPLVEVQVMVNSNGETRSLGQAGSYLRDVCEALDAQYGESVRETLDRLLGSTFLEHMRERIGQASKLIDDINAVLREHPTGTDRTTLRIALQPGVNASVLAAITGSDLLNPTVADQVRQFLKGRVDEAKRAALDEGLADWRDSLAAHLDYRKWYSVFLEHRVADGRWAPLTTRRYAELSGGARAVMLMLPLVAALAAQYQHVPMAPRPLWLDEAFDGLDMPNRRMMLKLLQRFDLDVLLAGPGRLVNVEEVPAAAIYQVVRAPAPEPGADLTAELWAGNTLSMVTLPLSWLDEAPSLPSGQDALL